MILITEDQRRKLLANGQMNASLRDRGFEETDYKPVVNRRIYA